MVSQKIGIIITDIAMTSVVVEVDESPCSEPEPCVDVPSVALTEEAFHLRAAGGHVREPSRVLRRCFCSIKIECHLTVKVIILQL